MFDFDFTTFKDLRNLALAADALALAGGVALLGLFILQENTSCLKEAYNDEALTTLLVISSVLTSVAAVVVLGAMLLNLRFVSKARKACVRLEESGGQNVMVAQMDNAMKQRMMTDKEEYDSNKYSTKVSLWVQLVSNVAAWGLNIVLVVFMGMSWGNECEDMDCSDDRAVELSILSTLYGAAVFLFQSTVAILVVLHLLNVDNICDKKKFPSFPKMGAAKFQSWGGRMRQRVSTFPEF
jgi:hypothetical protein